MITTDSGSVRPLRILAIHRYFWPDTPPYASMLRAITARWASDGHQVHVLSTQPSYKRDVEIERQPPEETIDSVMVTRVDLPREHGRTFQRVLNIARFCLAIVWHARSTGPYDVIMASTAPPVLVAAAARFGAWLNGASFIYHCMDVHPEMGRVTGEFQNPLVYRALRLIDSWTARTAARVVVLSRDMDSAIRRRPGCEHASIEIINNFTLPDYGEGDHSSPTSRESEKFRIVFAGNVGRFQGLESVVDAMHDLADEVELVFMGEGSALEDLKTRSGKLLGTSVVFLPHQSQSRARELVRSADACLVSLRPQICRFAFPSKTMTYLAEGRPLLVCVEPDSSLADFVRSKRVGIVVPPSDGDGFVHAVRSMVRNPSQLREMERRARDVATTEFDTSIVLGCWSDLLRRLARSRSETRES